MQNSCIPFRTFNFQKYTQSNGRRPFGLSALLIGYDDGPHLYQTDPSGTYHEWKVIQKYNFKLSLVFMLQLFFSVIVRRL